MSRLTDFLESHMDACYVKSHFGFDCPGCGSQRALIALLKGDLLESIQYNPGIIPVIFTISYTILHLIFKFKNGGRLLIWFYCGTISVFIINYILKMSGLISGHP